VGDFFAGEPSENSELVLKSLLNGEITCMGFVLNVSYVGPPVAKKKIALILAKPYVVACPIYFLHGEKEFPEGVQTHLAKSLPAENPIQLVPNVYYLGMFSGAV
jgi:hypothetical protein